MKKLTSIEIARLAGVSRSTVSRVINGYSNVPDETRKRVMKVVDEQEYYPMLSGQMLAGKGTGTLGFFWVSETPIANDIQCSAFFAHVTEAAAALGYLVLTCIVKNLKDEDNIRWVKRIFMQGRVDAGIFIGAKNNEPLIEELIVGGKIVGLFDHFHPNHRETNRVSVNFEQATGEKVISYVCGLGHKRIAIIDGNMNHYSCMMRHESFIRSMMQHSIEIRPEWMIYADINERAGYAAAKKLLENCRGDYPTVICANNDSTAFGVYAALQEAGFSIPGQISVIGIDGHERGKFLLPPLTTFAFDFQKFFYSLVERTIGTIMQKGYIPLTEFIPSVLVERGSCAKIL